MSERLVGVDEADANGYVAGLRAAQHLIMQEGKFKNHSAKFFAEQIAELLQGMINRQLGIISPPHKSGDTL